MAPAGGQTATSGCAVRRMPLAPTHESEDCCPDGICQRRKHAGGGLACTQHMEQQPGSIQAEVC